MSRRGQSGHATHVGQHGGALLTETRMKSTTQ